jgi:hypothetical protein
MRKYELKFLPMDETPQECVTFVSPDAASAFSWAERKAHGREFEIHEDGCKLGTAKLAREGNFWILT